MRPFLAPERSAPDQDPGPRFLCRDAAESYANRRALHQTMILEKLAPAGCWLPLTTLG